MTNHQAELPDVSLPPIHRALRELHLLTQQTLEPTRTPRPIAARIYRATLNASVAMASARVDIRQQPHLRRIRLLLGGTLELLGILSLEGYLEHDSYRKLRELIDRIHRGLQQLAKTELPGWHAVELPESDADSEQRTRTAVAVLRHTVERVSKAAPPSRGNAAAPKPSRTLKLRARAMRRQRRRSPQSPGEEAPSTEAPLVEPSIGDVGSS